MAKNNTQNWLTEILTAEELKENAQLMAEMHATPGKESAYEKGWFKVLTAVNQHVHESPTTQTAMALVKGFLELVDGLYGEKYKHLRTRKFELGFCKGKGLEGTGLTLESALWLQQAMANYCEEKLYAILTAAEKTTFDGALDVLDKAICEIYGDAKINRKHFLYKKILDSKELSTQAKTLLKTFTDS